MTSNLIELAEASSVTRAFGYGFVLWLTYWCAVGIYRILFHPLARFPGPKLAGLTFWYEFYYEIYPNKFQYMWKIKELHEQYGPIVRINPIHIHIHDHDFFDKIYAGGSHKRDRDPWTMHTGSRNFAGSLLETIDHDTHKMRRGAVSAFFSKRAVQTLNPLVITKVELLLNRLTRAKEEGVVVNLNEAFSAMTLDIISEYCFGESMGSLEKSAYGKDWLDLLHQGIQVRPLARQFPSLFNIMFDLPPQIMEKMNPRLGFMNRYNEAILEKIEKVMRYEDGLHEKGIRTIFHEIRDGNLLPPEEKKAMRLRAEEGIFLGAGTETTARTLAVTTFYLLQHDSIRAKLRMELQQAIPERGSTISLPQLEALPYLTAVVNEGLRIAHGVSSRQPRIATQEDLQYKQWTIPRGTPVMQSAYLLHTDPTVFPEPFVFKPERFLENPRLLKSSFPFGKGSRACIAMNLAISEIYYTLALLFRRIELELVDTIEERDVRVNYDVFMGLADLGIGGGIKARVVGDAKS
ncbi:putative benzoate 4-monooxygenase cytochrome P450 [Amniculicola lignicola CBS 123094]|uniref:Putative benzoate 4-monooxygenase cytochrome P450 n=1 Tax=Amniculicola lignicola CBS 123094 TaxID=1392246 RepID=A0A6A5WL77_9PLEO|nr:putative benzoate 4-monooxygenase cytochrome P450 [Amniculicola lignicola CBS 123094]